jgi:hypothetical protein
MARLCIPPPVHQVAVARTEPLVWPAVLRTVKLSASFACASFCFVFHATTKAEYRNTGKRNIEREERYCEIGALRMQQEVLPFHATPQPHAVQQEIAMTTKGE